MEKRSDDGLNEDEAEAEAWVRYWAALDQGRPRAATYAEALAWYCAARDEVQAAPALDRLQEAELELQAAPALAPDLVQLH